MEQNPTTNELDLIQVIDETDDLVQILGNLQRLRTGGEQHHSEILYQHFHHFDFGDGSGVPVTCHRFLLG